MPRLPSEDSADWIFFLDADETVPDELKREIDKHIARDRLSGY